MADERFQLAIDALRRIEDNTATVVPTGFGGVYTCAVAPSLASLNFVRVDVIDGLIADVAAARAAAHEHSLKTIVVDASAGPMTNAMFEGDDSGRYWMREVRGIYVWDAEPAEPSCDVEQISLDDFITARRKFLEASPDYEVAEADEEEAAVRMFADAVLTQYWAVHADGEVVSVGELYMVEDVAQLESLSTLPAWEGRGFGTAVTQARVNAARAEGASAIFGQIVGGNDGSVAVHERAGFTHVGLRNTFVLI